MGAEEVLGVKKLGPYQQRRGELEVISALCYVPKRRKARHHQDSFSVALLLAKDLPDHGRQWAWDLAPILAKLVPPVVDLLATPPQSERRARRGTWYLAGELAVAVASILGLSVARPLRWADEGRQAGKSFRGQWSKGLGLAKRVEVLEPEAIAGRRIALLDDLATTLVTLEVTARALLDAGAVGVWPRTLAWTERTEQRPADERQAVKRRAAVHKLRTEARAGIRTA